MVFSLNTFNTNTKYMLLHILMIYFICINGIFFGSVL